MGHQDNRRPIPSRVAHTYFLLPTGIRDQTNLALGPVFFSRACKQPKMAFRPLVDAGQLHPSRVNVIAIRGMSNLDRSLSPTLQPSPSLNTKVYSGYGSTY